MQSIKTAYKTKPSVLIDMVRELFFKVFEFTRGVTLSCSGVVVIKRQEAVLGLCFFSEDLSVGINTKASAV